MNYLPGGGGGVVLGKHAQHQLTQELEVCLPFAGDLHPQPPGIDSADSEAPGEDAKPPFPDTVGHSKI